MNAKYLSYLFIASIIIGNPAVTGSTFSSVSVDFVYDGGSVVVETKDNQRTFYFRLQSHLAGGPETYLWVYEDDSYSSVNPYSDSPVLNVDGEVIVDFKRTLSSILRTGILDQWQLQVSEEILNFLDGRIDWNRLYERLLSLSNARPVDGIDTAIYFFNELKVTNISVESISLTLGDSPRRLIGKE